MEQIVLLGGDARMQAAAENLQEAGYDTIRLSVSEDGCIFALHDAAALVLPIPALSADGWINGFENALTWTELQAQLSPTCLLCGGGVSRLAWPRTLDLLTDEGFADANALPTALASAGKLRGVSDR